MRIAVAGHHEPIVLVHDVVERDGGEVAQVGFFMAMGGLGVSLAGFAGLFTALRRPDEELNLDVYRWRIRHIVVSAFQLSFVAFGVVVFYEATGDVELTSRLFSGIAAAIFAVGAALQKPGPGWPNEPDRKAARVATLVWAAVIAGNVVVGVEWYLMAVMLILFLAPVLTFVRAVIDTTRTSAAAT